MKDTAVTLVLGSEFAGLVGISSQGALECFERDASGRGGHAGPANVLAVQTWGSGAGVGRRTDDRVVSGKFSRWVHAARHALVVAREGGSAGCGGSDEWCRVWCCAWLDAADGLLDNELERLGHRVPGCVDVREVLDEEVGAFLLEILGRVGCACGENAGSGSLACANTGGSILDYEGLERRGVAASSAEEVRIRVGLSLCDAVGCDEDVGSGKTSNGECLAGVEFGGRGTDGPLLLTITEMTVGGEVVEELLDTGEDLDTGSTTCQAANLLGVGEDGSLETHDFGGKLGLRDRAPLAECVDRAVSVCRVENVLEVERVLFGKELPRLDDSWGRVDKCSVHVEEDRVDIDLDDVGVGRGSESSRRSGKGATARHCRRVGEGRVGSRHGRHLESLFGEYGHCVQVCR